MWVVHVECNYSTLCCIYSLVFLFANTTGLNEIHNTFIQMFPGIIMGEEAR